jgi:hypothetical protein
MVREHGEGGSAKLPVRFIHQRIHLAEENGSLHSRMPRQADHRPDRICQSRLPVRFVAVNYEFGIGAAAEFVQVHANAFAVLVNAEGNGKIKQGEE